MNTNSMQPKVIFLYSLPKNKVAEMEQKRFNYSLFINKIQGIEGVEVHELCEDFFSTTHKCQILIVLGEYMGGEQALLLKDDSLFPLNELINKINISCSCVEVIDLAFCYSGEWREKLKKLTNALVNGNNEKTQVEARLQLYPLLLLRKDLGRENYKESYDIILDKLEKKQNRRNPQELANLPESTKLGTMSTSAAPKTVYRNSPFQVKVYIHIDGNEADINAEINGYGYIPRKIRDLKLNNDDQILWELSFNTNPKPEYAKHILGADRKNIIWDSEKTKVDYTFECFVEQEFEVNGFNGILKTTVGKNEIDKWTFPVTVLPYKDDKTIDKGQNSERQGEESKPSIEAGADTISKVSYDAVLREYGDKNLNQLKEYIEKQIEKAKDTHMLMSPELQDNYDDIKNEIDKLQEYNKNDLSDKWKRLYVCDKRLEMLIELKIIRDRIIPLAENKKDEQTKICDRTAIKNSSKNFFWLIEYDKIDVDIYSIISKAYRNDDGDELLRFPYGDLRMAYNGLAIKMAYKDIDDTRIKYYIDYKRDHPKKNEKIPQIPAGEKCERDVNWTERSRLVKNEVTKYLNRLIKDKDIKLELELYLKREPSSIFAYYLRALFD